MAVHGYVTHAAANRRKLGWLFACYIIACELMAAFALSLLLLLWDPGNTIFNNPQGYAIRYIIPVALIAALLFRRFYVGQLSHVTKRLGVAILSPYGDHDTQTQRFLRIGEEQCLALCIRLPQFGIIDVPESNALAVGATRNSGLIAVTRGLLDTLDDDELACVLAHEAAHIRNGDTQILAANHALMRTAVNIQINNPLRFEDPKQAILILGFPFFLPILLAGGAVTMLSMQMSFYARRGIALTRDLIADGDAVRQTHFPDALISALKKVASRADFENSAQYQNLLFCAGFGGVDSDEPAITHRIAAITSLGRSMMDGNRVRRDTRPLASRAIFGATPRTQQFKGTPKVQLMPIAPRFLEILARPKSFIEWHEACVDYGAWKESDKRDALGIKPTLYLPLAVVITFLITLHWPSNGDFAGSLALFNPSNLVEMLAPGPETIRIFPGASAEAKMKQGYISAVVLILFFLSATIPGVREYIYPNVDWAKTKRKSGKDLVVQAAQTWGKPSAHDNAIEQALARFKHGGGAETAPSETAASEPAHMRNIVGHPTMVPPQPTPRATPIPSMAPRPAFGKKGL